MATIRQKTDCRGTQNSKPLFQWNANLNVNTVRHRLIRRVLENDMNRQTGKVEKDISLNGIGDKNDNVDHVRQTCKQNPKNSISQESTELQITDFFRAAYKP